MALTSLAGSAKISVKRESGPSSPAVKGASASKPASSNTSKGGISPVRAASPHQHLNRYFDIVVLLSVLVFIVLAAGLGILVLEQATTWRV